MNGTGIYTSDTIQLITQKHYRVTIVLHMYLVSAIIRQSGIRSSVVSSWVGPYKSIFTQHKATYRILLKCWISEVEDRYFKQIIVVAKLRMWTRNNTWMYTFHLIDFILFYFYCILDTADCESIVSIELSQFTRNVSLANICLLLLCEEPPWKVYGEVLVSL
jgi:hypothetical protein